MKPSQPKKPVMDLQSLLQLNQIIYEVNESFGENEIALKSICRCLHQAKLLNQCNFDRLIKSVYNPSCFDALDGFFSILDLLLKKNSLNQSNLDKVINLYVNTLSLTSTDDVLYTLYICLNNFELEPLTQEVLEGFFYFESMSSDLLIELLNALQYKKLLTASNIKLLTDFNIADYIQPLSFPISELSQSYFEQQILQIPQLLMHRIQDFNKTLEASHPVKKPLGLLLRHLNHDSNNMGPLFRFQVLQAVDDALQSANNADSEVRAETLDKLIEFGDKVHGQPRPQLQTLGRIMMILGGVLAMTAGITLSVTSMGLLSPLGIACGIGVASALSGVGLYAKGRRRGLSKHLYELEHSLQTMELDSQSTDQPQRINQ